MSSQQSSQFTADKRHLAFGYFFQQSFGIVCNAFSLVLFVVSDIGMRNLEFTGENSVDPERLEKQSLNVSKTSLSLERSAISSSDSVNSSSTHSVTALRLALLAREGD